MVYNKIITIFFLSVTMWACESKVHLTPYSIADEKKIYCFQTIKDELEKVTNYNVLLKNSIYSRIGKESALRLLKKNNKAIRDKFAAFFDQNDNVESFVVEYNSKKVIILIGKALGASGIGVDYWNYKVFSIGNDNIIIEFSSLIKTPYSLYLDYDKNINYFEVENDYPRPANNEIADLEYLPVILRVFDNNVKKHEVGFKCKAAY